MWQIIWGEVRWRIAVLTDKETPSLTAPQVTFHKVHSIKSIMLQLCRN
jgi:hypothetical protein